MHSWREECGVVGVWDHEDAARLAYLSLYAIQHRGQESTGIVSLDQGQHIIHKGLGLVGDVFQEADLQKLSGTVAMGHVRYSTTGANFLANAQPLTANLLNGPVALAHNGNIINSQNLRTELQMKGAIFQGTSDTELILHLLSRVDSADIVHCLQVALAQITGAYSLICMTHDKLIAVRDPYGFRPLVLGKKRNQFGGESLVLASETCAFDLIGAQFIREIEPGEIFWIDESGGHSLRLRTQSSRIANCIFEHVYFSRPDSIVFGHSVYESRKNFGKWLAKEDQTAADIVVPVPDSGVPAALGYSIESGIPFELGIIRNHYVGRTFIQPHQSVRSFGVKVKLNPQTAVLKGKRVIVIDDSLVRGTTSQKIIGLVRAAGATQVHMRIAAPPTKGPCFYGVDTPQSSDLIASTKSIDEIAKFIGADSLGYLSQEGLFSALGAESKGGNKRFCAACFDGDYPAGTPL